MRDYFKFLSFIKPHIGIFTLAVLCMLMSAIFEASPLGLIIPLVDVIISGKEVRIPYNDKVPDFLANIVATVNSVSRLELLYILTAAVVVFFLLRGLFVFLQTYLMSDVSERVIRDIKNRIYSKLVFQSMSFYSHNPTGQLMSRITYDAAVVRDAISSGVADTFHKPIEIVVYLIALIALKIYFAIPTSLIIIGAVVFPLILLPVKRIGDRLRVISKRSQERIADINNMLLETITGIKLVKSFNMQEYEKKRFAEHNQIFYKLSMKAVKRMKIVSPLTEAMAVICVAVIMWMAGKSIISGELSAGIFTAFLAAIFSLMKPVKKLSAVYGINQQAMAATDRIFELLETEVSIDEKFPAARKIKSFEREIKFDKVTFRYGKNEPNVVCGIDLAIKKGEVVAIVGPSGAGKTTLVNMLTRFYDPVEGNVYLDGVSLKEISIQDLREHIGLVTQETLLFNDTVKANLAYGHDDINTEKLIEAAMAANAHVFIKAFPDGYDTIIGERGVKVSGGQRQRIAIARAIYKNPPILILDEATSQLDSESERLVQDALNKLMMGRTVIAIAHRLSTIMHADKIVVMEKGRIVDTGTHAELLRKNMLYKKLYEMQIKGSEVNS